MAIVSLGLITAGIPPEMVREDTASFEAAEAEATPPGEIDRFELGDAPLDPTELNADTLAMTRALPQAAQEARKYDDSKEFEEAGGSGSITDRKEPKFGGLGGPFVLGLTGPAGHGGVGVGVGVGTHAGLGGPGDGYGLRNRGQRKAWAGAIGGTPASECAVGAALNWLARHQTAAGHWSLDFRRQCRSGTCSGTSAIRSDSAATAMALLPFLAAGQTHKSKGPYQQTIAKGLAWLVAHQSYNTGDLSDRGDHQMYSHGLATIALCEAYGITKDEQIGNAAKGRGVHRTGPKR